MCKSGKHNSMEKEKLLPFIDHKQVALDGLLTMPSPVLSECKVEQMYWINLLSL